MNLCEEQFRPNSVHRRSFPQNSGRRNYLAEIRIPQHFLFRGIQQHDMPQCAEFCYAEFRVLAEFLFQ